MSTQISNDSYNYARQMDANHRFKRHKFDKQIVRMVSKYLSGNKYSGIFEVIEDWAVVALSILFALYTNQLSTVLGIISYLISVIIIGGRQRAIADILHQSSHGAAASNTYLNLILGTLCSGYTVLQSFTIYTASHVKLHHPWLGNPHKDPDYIGLIANNICGVNRNCETTKNYIYSIMSPVSSYKYLKYLIVNRIYDKNENKIETVIRLIYWFCVLYVIQSNEWMTYFILFWIIPLITSNVWIGSLLELLEHFPMIDDESIPFIDLLLTKNRIWCGAVNFILGVHNEGYHLVHHLFPKLASWHYVSVHQILMNDDVYAHLDHGEQGCVSMIKQVIKNSENSKKFKPKQQMKKRGCSMFMDIFSFLYDACNTYLQYFNL